MTPSRLNICIPSFVERSNKWVQLFIAVSQMDVRHLLTGREASQKQRDYAK
jgi:hypothetical protein